MARQTLTQGVALTGLWDAPVRSAPTDFPTYTGVEAVLDRAVEDGGLDAIETVEADLLLDLFDVDSSEVDALVVEAFGGRVVNDHPSLRSGARPIQLTRQQFAAYVRRVDRERRVARVTRAVESATRRLLEAVDAVQDGLLGRMGRGLRYAAVATVSSMAGTLAGFAAAWGV